MQVRRVLQQSVSRILNTMNLFNLERVFQQKKERKWHTIYVAVDAHGTLIKAYHDHIEFYTGAVEVMQWFNSREDFKVILWTSTRSEEHTSELQSLRHLVC